ncbi:MAG: hypothetical protein SFX18_04385 [Pirellulales bacterium]|nr:hypothetical protein [Pirellulales bacterium]
MQRDQVLHAAMALPVIDREYVILALEKSLVQVDTPQPDEIRESESGLFDQDLLEELQSRSAGYRNGTIQARSAEEVLADLQSSLADEIHCEYSDFSRRASGDSGCATVF